MDFLGIILFLILYIIRPQEWMPYVDELRPVTLAMGVALGGMIFRSRGFSPKSFFKTPHDYAMLAFFLWIVLTGGYWKEDLGKIKNHFLFYFVFVQALSEMKRIENFVAWWTGLMILIAGLAIASEFGFDPANSHENTHGMFMGRLVFHNSLYNNPNGLGHGVVPAVGMIYFFCFWKRPIFIKEVGLVLLSITLWCVYLTQSKGAFLAGFAAIVTTLCFGRAKIFQVLVLAVAFTVGMAGLQMLPRMQDMNEPRKDAGIQGRLDAFRFGLAKMEENRYGIGLYTFADRFEEQYGINMSPHSSYVGMGAELGWTGLALYLSIFYCSIRVLVTAKTTTPEEERVRRILMVLNISFIVSTWMINWGHQANYWLIAAVTAAFHRHLLSKDEPAPVVAAEPEKAKEIKEVPIMVAVPGMPAAAMTTTLAGVARLPVPTGVFAQLLARRAKQAEKPPPKSSSWKRIGVVDVALVWLMTHYTVEFWSYIIKRL